MSEELFELTQGFEQGAVEGNVRLGKLESQYEELFSEALEDGVITAEERARLDRVADSLGLDRRRIGSLEQALQVAYEQRHRVIVRHEDDTEPRASLRPLELEQDPRFQAILRRVQFLESRVAELERELEEAQSHIAVEVDFSDYGSAPTEDPDELFRRLRHDPRDAKTLHSLFHTLSSSGDHDRAYGVAHALAFLGEANDEERAHYEAHKPDGLIRPQASITPEAWRRLVFHPDEEILTGEIFSVIVSAVLLGRVAALRHQNALPKLDPARLQDPKTSTVQAVRCFSWAASLMGMQAPPLYADPTFEAAVEMVPGIPPTSRLGKRSLSGRSPVDLAFLAGRHLASYREDHFIRLLLPSIPDLEDIFLAALSIGNPGLPLSADVRARVTPIAKAIEPILEPVQVDRLRGHFLRFVEEGGRTNLQRWAAAAELTTHRAGLLLAGDLAAASRMLELEGVSDHGAKVDDLIVFSASDRMSNLRKQIGIALPHA
jgi:golgin subfamily B member 1